MKLKLRRTFAALSVLSVVAVSALADVELTPAELADGISRMSGDERVKASAMLEAINSCTTDCTILGIAAKGNSLYNKKVAAGQKDATITVDTVSQGFSKLSPDQRLKVSALVEAAKSCTKDCSLQNIMSSGATIYNQKVATGETGANIGIWGVANSAKPATQVSATATTKVEYNAAAGAEFRGGSGGSAAVGGDVTITSGEPAKGALSYTAIIKADVGSTSGWGNLPAGKVGFAVSGDASRGAVGSVLNPLLNKVDPMNLLELKKSWVVGVNLDRDLVLGRTARVNAQAGVALTHGSPYEGNSWTLNPMAEVGFGRTGAHTLPYATIGIQALGVYCPFMSKSGSDEVCGELGLKGMAGAVQLEGAYNADLMWRHKVADNSSTKAVHSISLVAGVDGEGFVDVDGVQGASNIGAKIVIH